MRVWHRLAPWVIAAIALLSTARAEAHRGSSKRLIVERLVDGAQIVVVLERVDAAVEVGLDEAADSEAVLARGRDVVAWLEGGIELRADGRRCLVQGEPLTADDTADPPEVQTTLRYTCAAAAEVELTDRTIFEDDPQHEAYVRRRFRDGTDAHVLRRGRQSLRLGEPVSTLALLGRFVEEGVIHLVTGYDHVLFLLSLILTAGGLARREGLKRALRDVAVIVSMFTLGHSVTLLAAALEWVVLPSRWVEATIALSIVLTAAINLVRPEARKAMPWVAAGFGLVHGFGFSGVLAELGLPTQARVGSLLAFNLGIELAQLAFVAACLPALAWIAKEPPRERGLVVIGSAAIALMAGYWFIERALGA